MSTGQPVILDVQVCLTSNVLILLIQAIHSLSIWLAVFTGGNVHEVGQTPGFRIFTVIDFQTRTSKKKPHVSYLNE